MVVENLPLSFRFTQMEISTFEASLAAFLVGKWNVCKRFFFLLREGDFAFFFLKTFHSVRTGMQWSNTGQFAHIAVEFFIDSWVSPGLLHTPRWGRVNAANHPYRHAWDCIMILKWNCIDYRHFLLFLGWKFIQLHIDHNTLLYNSYMVLATSHKFFGISQTWEFGESLDGLSSMISSWNLRDLTR